jgi:hypothetical protein
MSVSSTVIITVTRERRKTNINEKKRKKIVR